MALRNSNWPVLSTVLLFAALLTCEPLRCCAQESFVADFYGNKKLAKATAERIRAKRFGKPPRIAVFQWGDKAGGLPEDKKQHLLDANIRFVAELERQANNSFTVLGPEAIEHELEVRKMGAKDLAGIGFGRPDKVSNWLKTALNGEVPLALVGREPNQGVMAELELIDLNGKSEIIKAEEDGTVMHRWVNHAEQSDYQKMTIIPELFLKVSGEDQRRRLEIYTGGVGASYSVAVIPGELQSKLGEGLVTLEIELNHSGKWPEMMVDQNKYYKLSADPTRLCAVAVTIDGQSTIAERKRNFVSGKDESVYPRLPPEQLRKWVVSQPGYIVEPANRPGTHNVKKVAKGAGHGRIPIRGFQESSDEASLFTLSPPAEGAAEAAGIHSSPGVIWIAAFAEKKNSDRYLPNVAGASPGAGVAVKGGARISNKVNPIIVNCYPDAVEEHVILLRTPAKADPKKEEGRELYPPVPVTN